MTWQDFLTKGNGIQKSQMSLMPGQALVQNKLPFAQCTASADIGYRCGLKFKAQVAPYLIFLYRQAA